MSFSIRVVENHPQNSCLLFSATKKSIPHHSPESAVENRRLGDRGSVADAPEHIRQAIAADPAKAKLWEALQTKTFEELAWGVLTGWKGVEV